MAVSTGSGETFVGLLCMFPAFNPLYTAEAFQDRVCVLINVGSKHLDNDFVAHFVRILLEPFDQPGFSKTN